MPLANAASSQPFYVCDTKIAVDFLQNWAIAVLYTCLEPSIPIEVDTGLSQLSAALGKTTFEIYCDSPR
jgi:hypothetical protein